MPMVGVTAVLVNLSVRHIEAAARFSRSVGEIEGNSGQPHGGKDQEIGLTGSA